MEAFEERLAAVMPQLERFVKFRIQSRADAEDVLQETCMAAFRRRDTLKNPDAFLGWLLSVARNKCNDYYREKAKLLELPIEQLSESVLSVGLYGKTEQTAVSDTLERLGDRDRQMLYLYYFQNLPQERIAKRLGIPLGTVKSRLFHAKRRFKKTYPNPPQPKGDTAMKQLPTFLPPYTITPSDLPPFAVRWEEMMGWFIVPKIGETCAWAMYDMPERKRTELCEMRVTGPAEVHGIEGVEIVSLETDPMECNSAGGQNPVERRFVAQLTDTHCRYLAESHTENGVKRYYTFLDGDAFLNNWGFGEDNCGNEIEPAPKGDIVRSGDRVTTKDKTFLLDVVGRYTVAIGGKTYDTVCVMDCYTYIDGVVSEQYIDRNGRTVLWRRFNRDDWAIEHYKKPWSELLPSSERLYVNGSVYVHWYDCITDYIL